MKKFLIRNDDIAYDTKLNTLKEFCEICDQFGYKIIQAITPYGECRKARVFKDNDQIIKSSNKKFADNIEVVDFLSNRKDLIGLHGLWHTHIPTEEEIETGKKILEDLGFKPTYFVTPFNEGDYPNKICGLKVSKLDQKKDNLERYLHFGKPDSPIMYLHSWRFAPVYYTFNDLRKCLSRLQN